MAGRRADPPLLRHSQEDLGKGLEEVLTHEPELAAIERQYITMESVVPHPPDPSPLQTCCFYLALPAINGEEVVPFFFVSTLT